MKLLPLRARRYLVLALALLAGAGVVAGWSLSGRPVALPDGPERLDCASYAPPRFDATDRPATRAEIEADLRIVARRFQCIRTYSTEGIDNVPAAARAAGLRLLLGAWIGSDPRSNRREVERVIDLANRNRGVIDAVVVGNEVFLRRELSVEKLRALLVEVKTRTGLPVTTADIWAFWPQDPEFLDSVSFMMVHILPYWDDEPVSIDAVLPHVQQVYADMTRKFPGKAIMIGETGWPSAGRPRGALEAGRVNAARYVREFTAWAAASGIRYNLIEAFDQPWKRPNEGTVGGFWGLYDQSGLEKFPLQGPVMENPRWRTSLGFSLAAGVLLPMAVAVMRRRALSVAAGMFLGLAGLSATGAILWQSAYLQAGNRDWLDWCVTLTWAAAGWSVAGLVVATVTRWLDAPETTGGPVRLPRERLLGSDLFRAARFTVLLGAAYVALGLVLAGRHRDFPLALLAVPAVALLALEAAGGLQRRSLSGPPQFLLGMWLAVAAPLVVWIEGTGNSSALAVSGLFLLLAWPVLRLPPEAGQHQGPRHHANGRKLEAVENGASDARAQGQVSQRR